MPIETTKIAPFTVSYETSDEFHTIKNEIFTQNVYYFETKNPEPVIIDAGAHIGLATLYFKKLYPDAHVTAIEPNPQVLHLLKQNIEQNHLENVSVFPIALSETTGEKSFFIDSSEYKWWSTGSFESGAWNHQQSSKAITVETQPLSFFLQRPIDLLKIDIEGAEFAVLREAAAQLKQVKHLILEFHPTQHQSLMALVEFLKEHRFEVQVWQDGKEVRNNKYVKGLCYVEAINQKVS